MCMGIIGLALILPNHMYFQVNYEYSESDKREILHCIIKSDIISAYKMAYARHF
jgi:hypothetical protein